MIIGTGTDILSTLRVKELMDTAGSSFIERCFTASEREYCSGKLKPWLHFAARLAAKEAVIKTLRLPASDGVRLREAEIVLDGNHAPGVILHGKLLARARELNVGTMHVSLSHSDEYATATALAEAAEPGKTVNGR